MADFRLVADSTYDWESWHAPDSRLIWVNPAVAYLTGYEVAECLAMPGYPLPMVAPHDRDRLAVVLAQAAARQSGNDVEFTCLHKNGSPRAMAISWRAMYDQSGVYLGYRTSTRDVTERRRLQDEVRLHAEHLEQLVEQRSSEIRELEKRHAKVEQLAALSQLAAGIAHEINNPLAGIRNAFELLRTDLPPEHPRAELFGLVDREIDRMSHIIHQMYQLYGAASRVSQAFSFQSLVNEVVLLLAPQAQRAGVKLVACLPTDSIVACLPTGEVKQVLINLTCNAIHASQAGQQVTIDVRAEALEACVVVRDEGPGIAAEDLPRIFDPFFSRWPNARKNSMGLGLSVSQNLVSGMAGRIEVTSERDRGASFKVFLPLAAQSSQVDAYENTSVDESIHG